MAVKKRGDNRLVLLAVAALLLIALFAVWMNGSQKQQEEVGVVSRPQVTPKPIEETIENGVYINHTFGFKFEYPEEVFGETVLVQSSDYGFHRGFQKKGLTYDGWGLSVYASESSIDQFTKYREMSPGIPLYSESEYEQKPKYEWPIANTIKLTNITTQGRLGYIDYMYSTGGGEGEPTWGYSASWRDQDRVITLSVNVARGADYLESEYKQVFFNVVNGFEFIDK